jgi:hypothetical protein
MPRIKSKVLRQVRPHAVGNRARRDRHVAHRQPADVPGGGQVALHQRRRDRQHVGDIVESAALVVWREERRCVDLERQQVADGVCVLGAVQPMQGRAAWTWSRGGRAVDRRLQIADESVQRGGVGPRHSRGRHHAGADFPDHFLPELGRLRDVREIRVLERQLSRTRAVVVTRDAVRREHRGVRCGRRGRPRGRPGALRGPCRAGEESGKEQGRGGGDQGSSQDNVRSYRNLPTMSPEVLCPPARILPATGQPGLDAIAIN